MHFWLILIAPAADTEAQPGHSPAAQLLRDERPEVAYVAAPSVSGVASALRCRRSRSSAFFRPRPTDFAKLLRIEAYSGAHPSNQVCDVTYGHAIVRDVR
jgi:hypothetical protein